MKRAKQYPFLKLQRQRLSLYFSNRSTIDNVPSEHNFYRWIWHAIKNNHHCAAISLLLLDEAEARTLNRDYRGKDYATNILSFTFDEDWASPRQFSESLYGDLFICPQVVLREAAEQGKVPQQHFAHLTIHGTLHLMGYDHIVEDEALVMEALETRLLNQLGYPDPYC